MPFPDIATDRIILSYNSVGDTWIMPFYADVTGTWHLVLDDDTIVDFDAVAGESVTFPNIFTNDEDNYYKILRADNSLFNNRQYVTLISYGVVTNSYFQTVSSVGDIRLTITEENKLSYTNAVFTNLLKYYVFLEGAIEFLNPLYEVDDESGVGTFSWNLEVGQQIVIQFFK